jgi:hypothetical protein
MGHSGHGQRVRSSRPPNAALAKIGISIVSIVLVWVSAAPEGAAQDIEVGALEYAHGVAALQREQWAVARSACGGAARALEGDPATRQQLGRAQLCVVDALQGLGLYARAFGVLAHTIRNIEDGGRTNARYREDLDRAMALVGPLSRQIGRVQIAVTPAEACDAASSPALVVDGEQAPAHHACGEAALYLDPGRHRIVVTADGFRPMEAEIDVEAERNQRVALTAERDPSSRRWVRLVLREEGTALESWTESPCPAPCDRVVPRDAFLQGIYFVTDEDGRHRVQHDVLDGDGANEIVHVSSTAGWGWFTAVTGLALLTIGAPVAAALEVPALAITSALTGLVAGIVGLVWGIAAGPAYYGIE